MILVSGATGGIGGETCRILQQRGVPFRAMCRKQEQVDSLHGRGIDAVIGDFDRPDTLPAAMRGIDTMFLITVTILALSVIARTVIKPQRAR